MVFITINGQKERVDNFCGNKLPAQLMSNGPTMTVEFRSHHSSPEVKGFKAKYKFVTGMLWLTIFCFIFIFIRRLSRKYNPFTHADGAAGLIKVEQVSRLTSQISVG